MGACLRPCLSLWVTSPKAPASILAARGVSLLHSGCWVCVPPFPPPKQTPQELGGMTLVSVSVVLARVPSTHDGMLAAAAATGPTKLRCMLFLPCGKVSSTETTESSPPCGDCLPCMATETLEGTKAKLSLQVQHLLVSQGGRRQ